MYEATGMTQVAMDGENVAIERSATPSFLMPRVRNNRDQLPWSQRIWNRIDQAVHDECQRTEIASKFLPLYGPVAAGQTTVHSDTVVVVDGQSPQSTAGVLEVEETETTPFVEIVVEFKLTPQQVDREEELMTAVTLATRGANQISQAKDELVFNGQAALKTPLFAEKKVRLLSGNAGTGLLGGLSANQIVDVKPIDAKERRYGEETFKAVAAAYSRLQSGEGLAQSHYGPYALVLQHEQYADTYAPLATTLIMPADRIKPLVMAGFHGTGTVPPLTGLLVSIGGNTMDLVVGMDVTVSFQQQDADGRYRLRVWERFALRRKDKTAIIRLNFLETAPTGG
jgi:uncharacterized linocin/CFP29 family protein